jgi:adenine-specific DNA-methyltransferase
MITSTFEFNKFPTTRYLGSKRKIIPWIYSILKDEIFESVLDGFGGSGSVSYLLKKMNKSVTYNDAFKFNSIIGESIIQNQEIILNDEELEEILNTTNNKNNFIQINFKEYYFLEDENHWLDKTIGNIFQMSNNSASSRYKQAIAFNALFQSCLVKRPFNIFHRKNINIRTADVHRTFGNKATWDKSFDNHYRKFVLEINKSVFNSNKNCYALNKDIFEIENKDYDLVYLDPPYISNNSSNENSNYLKCYHFLEGIINYEKWGDLIDYSSNILMLDNNYKENHFQKGNIEDSFEKLICKFKHNKIVLSYKDNGIPDIKTIIQILEDNNKKTKIHKLAYKYALNKKSNLDNINHEYLIIAK